MDQYTDADLMNELSRRQGESQRVKRPTPIVEPDWTLVEKLVRDHLQQIEADEEDEDMPHYILEAAMTAVWGRGVWDYIRDVRRR